MCRWLPVPSGGALCPTAQVTVIDDCLGEGNGLFKQMEDAAVRTSTLRD